MKEVLMPRLGLNMERGTVTKWYVQEGSVVKADDILCDIESEKTVNGVRAEADGVVSRLLADEGAEVDVLSVIALINSPGE